MFNLPGWQRRGGRADTRQKVIEDKDAGDKTALRLLLVTLDDSLYFSIHSAATRAGWDLKLARNVEQSLRILDEFKASLLIYDWSPEEDDWRLAVDRFAARRDPPCVLLASRIVDEYLWTELLTHGGFDVVPRSAGAEELVRRIRFAHRASGVARGGRPVPR
jgi:DNA-binding response OmpR family regulator